MHQHPYRHAQPYMPPPPPVPASAPLRNTGPGIASLVVACVCLGTCLWGTAVLPLVGVILGAIGTYEARPTGQRRGLPMAIAGLAINVVLLLAGVAVVTALIADAY